VQDDSVAAPTGQFGDLGDDEEPADAEHTESPDEAAEELTDDIAEDDDDITVEDEDLPLRAASEG